MGLDFTQVAPADPAAQILGNAVFLTPHTPVRILDYRELSTWNSSAISNTVDLIADQAITRGRDVTTTVVPESSSVPADLASDNFDVLFVHSLEAAPAGTLAQLGAAWSTSIESFCAAGGVVVVVATTGGTNQMQDFLSLSGILNTSGLVDVGKDTLTVEGTSDPMSAGLHPTLSPIPGAAAFVTSDGPGPSLAFVITAGTAPVAVHRAYY
jgi:hypothetical protein